MKNVLSNAGPWILGTLVAFVGVALARTFGPSLDGNTRLFVTVGGEFLALTGLFIICLGVRRRIRQPAER